MGEREKANWRVNRKKVALSALAEKVCLEHGVSGEEFRSGSRRREIIEAREGLSQVAVKVLGYSGAKVARYLGVTGSCVTRLVWGGTRLEIWKERYGHTNARSA